MRFEGHLAGHPATFLVDCGATNDFVASSFIERHKLELTPTSRTVRGYDGKATPSLGTLQAPLTLRSDRGTVSDTLVNRPFTTADLRGEDAILGLPWLKDHNPQVNWATHQVQMVVPAGPVGKEAILVPPKATLITSRGASQASNMRVVEECREAAPASPRELEVEVPVPQSFFRDLDTSLYPPDWEPSVKISLTRTVETGPRQKADRSPINERLAQAIFANYTDVFPDQLPPGLPPSRTVDHRIELKPGAKPASRPSFRQSAAADEAINKEVERGLAMGIMRPSQSAFAATAFQVPKKPGDPEKRVVVDYRALNDITVKSKYPLPRMDELFDKLQGARYFSKLDLRTGFHQIRLALEDAHKTAFRTSKGLFEYLVLPMGLCNAPGTFMQLMNDVFSDLIGRGVLVFLDDIVIYTRTLEEHTELLHKVMKRLREHKLYAKQSKCSLYQTEVEFLGHLVGQHGLKVMQDKVKAVADWPVPRNAKDVRAFLGLAGFYRRFILHFSHIALPLSELTRTKPDDTTGKPPPFTWGDAQQQAFDRLKKALQSAPILALPDPAKPFVLHTDASGFATGAVLQQDQGQGLQPIAYLSGKMKPAELNYPVHEQELLAIINALRAFRHYLEGNKVVIKTDHKSLVYFQTQPMLSGRQARWLETLSRFDYTIEYIKGETNTVADAISRRPDLADADTPTERVPAVVDPSAKGSAAPALTEPPTTTAAELQQMSIFTQVGHQLDEVLKQTRTSGARRAELKRQQEREKAVEAATRAVPPSPDNPVPDAKGVVHMPSQRCTAEKKNGGQCAARTRKGQYCWTHTRAIEGLRIRASSIPGAGLGLWATKRFEAGDPITPYSGDLVPLHHDEVGGPYYLQLNRHRAIDAARTNTASGRYANDARGSNPRQGPNAALVLDTRRGVGRVKATAAINPGQEIFVSYGPSYWRSHAMPTGAPEPVVAASAEVEPSADDSSQAPLTEDQHAFLQTVLTTFQSPLLQALQQAVAGDPEYLKRLQHKPDPKGGTHSCNGLLYHRDRIWVPNDAQVRTLIMQECHDAATSGHLGRDKTVEQVKRRFYWVGMDNDIDRYVSSCDTCQRTKADQPLTAGLLQPLPIPPHCWHTVSHDLITGLPKSKAGHDAIYVVVCKLSRQVHYVPCHTNITAPELARLFMTNVVRLHGVPSHIISDRDPRFTGTFWQTLVRMLGSKLRMSTSFHPQTDGQTENSNKQLEQVLRSVVNFKQDDWDEHLAAAEMANNNSRNATTGFTPFFLNTGREVTMPIDTALEELGAGNPTAADTLKRWQAALLHATENISRAQRSQAKHADQHRREVAFKPGDLVLLSQQNIQLLGDEHRTRKLSTRFLGPYPVKRVVNSNAYELDLPASFRIHPVINVSQLKPYRDGAEEFPHREPPPSRPPPVTAHPTAASEDEWEVEAILDCRINRNSMQYLIKWVGYPNEESTWEPLSNLTKMNDIMNQFLQTHESKHTRLVAQVNRENKTRTLRPRREQRASQARH